MAMTLFIRTKDFGMLSMGILSSNVGYQQWVFKDHRKIMNNASYRCPVVM